MAAALEALRTVLSGAEDVALPPAQLLRQVDHGFLSERPQPSQSASEQQLHATRKLAKRARYQSEAASVSLLAQTAAERFEALQKSGGAWHDWLGIARSARKELGKRHPATLAFAKECDQNLLAFRKLIETFGSD